ncbi:MAG: acetoin utilization protein AcuC, partial [Propionibacteriaceae bacterium]|nr:acetoin utilization protein AcuC [Propionibacteriaceae bacterium]
DGVERVFWNDPRVLTISLHESGLHLFPHTGFPREVGGPDALGSAANVSFLPRTTDRAWLHSFAAIVPPLVAAFAPQVIVSQHGADPHRNDKLADLSLSVDAMALGQRLVIDLADEHADGRWIGLGGGGYNRDATARTWASMLASAQGIAFDPSTPTPPTWRDRADGQGSPTMGDPWADADPHWDASDLTTRWPNASIVATSRAVFPHWGLEAR